MTSWREQGTEPMSRKQQKMLNAVCGCLANQISWHGTPLTQNQWRWFLTGTAMDFIPVPTYDHGDGRRGIVLIGRSSKELSKSKASIAIEIGLHIGDQPGDQGLSCPPVVWSDAVYLGRGDNPNEARAIRSKPWGFSE